MNRTKIEWVRNPDGSRGYTINPVKGKCPMECSYCYAGKLYDRFKWDPKVRIENIFNELLSIPSGSKVFWGSTMELFGDWIAPAWHERIFREVRNYPGLIHIFLTKLPQNLPKEWPENCWVGVTATDTESFMSACTLLEYPLARLKFLSIEPFLSWDYNWIGSYLVNTLKRAKIGWIICGQQTPVRKSTMPRIEWIHEIVEAADKAGVSVFLKENLRPLVFKDRVNGQCALDMGLLTWAGELRQELPR